MIEYALEQQEILTELGIWRYLTDSEVQEIYNAHTEISIESLAKSYRDKYWADMLADYDKNKLNIVEDESVLKSDLSKTAKNALLRNGIHTMEEFADVVMDKGWSSIRGFGPKSAIEAFHWAFPHENEKTIQAYVKKYNNVYNKEC